MSEMRDKVKEKIARVDYEFGSPRAYFDWDEVREQDKNWYLRMAEAILSIPELAIVNREAELPDIIEQAFADVAKMPKVEHKNVLGDKWKFIDAVQKAMAGWVKEVKNEG